ncbi:MAG TPA: UDP-N-acetylmuramate dehydrogenase [Chryseosolibacter sp.]|nr:UDP-N-acetylmuramate dehydrogenase [Chryseosolibacter sp.]
MLKIEQDVNLLPFNTFRIAATARYFVVIRSLDDAREIFSSELIRQNRFLILGGGSNLLLTSNFDGLVIKNEIRGIETVAENDDVISLKVAAGENWHEFVMFCVERNYGGIENLSLIPGTVGAAPMQNIGAYGVEIKEVINTVEAIEIASRQARTFSNAACAFGYRESIFKQAVKDQFFISSITLSLTKRDHRFNISYGAISDILKENGEKPLSVKKISDAVVRIRQSKLPDPKVIGNAGSFFKNPTVNREAFEKLKRDFPSIPSFAAENGMTKISAAWLIEQCGWKGKTLENIGVHKLQALVLVNYGGGEGKKIWELAMNIQASVKEKFGVKLHPEVNVI